MANVQMLAADNGVREAAQNALLDLRQRLEAQRAPQTLLRTSSAAATRVDELVRPATGVGTVHEQVLLCAPTDVTTEMARPSQEMELLCDA